MLTQFQTINSHGKGIYGTFLLSKAQSAIVGYQAQVADMLQASVAAQDAVSLCLTRCGSSFNQLPVRKASRNEAEASQPSRSSAFTLAKRPVAFDPHFHHCDHYLSASVILRFRLRHQRARMVGRGNESIAPRDLPLYGCHFVVHHHFIHFGSV